MNQLQVALPEFLYRSDGGFIRIPVWGHIPLDNALKKILSHPSFLRLKGIKQLSFAHYVFPGATHSRFEHSIGVYHLTKLILQRLITNPLTRSLLSETFEFNEENCNLILAASILHDIGHYPHAHLVENTPLTSNNEIIFNDHQDLTKENIFLKHERFGSLAEILEKDWKVNPEKVAELVMGKKKSTFSKVISGTLDPDKMDYLMRDAHHCSVPYGNIDIERLIESFVPDSQRKRFAITNKGIAPFESLMFAKYAMMRNVYWHHSVRTISAMLKRFLQDALDNEALNAQQLHTLFYHNTDDRILNDILVSLTKPFFPPSELLVGLIERKIYKRAIIIPYDEHSLWQRRFAQNAKLRKQKEVDICNWLNLTKGLNLKGFEVVIDAPTEKSIFDYDDFSELQLYRENKKEYVRFNDCGESAFTLKFIAEFEKTTKKFRVTAREDLAPLVAKHEKPILEILKS